MDKPKGRPSKYSDELADLICERLACGESMRSISRDPDMPCMSTLFKWLREIESFSQQYAKAKEESADALVEDMLYIADNETDDDVVVDGERIKAKTGPSVAAARLRVDTRKWAASKLKPKKYGDKIDHVSSDGSMTPKTHLTYEIVEPVKVEARQIDNDD